MNIDTRTIRRIRDALVQGGDKPAVQAGGSAAVGRGRQAAARRVAPFVETMYLAMMADGEPGREEQAAIQGALHVLTRGLLDELALEEMLQVCEQQLREQGAEARLQAIGSRICGDRQDRETAFTLAAAVALADDTVVAEESALVASIAEWFGVSSRRSRDILGTLGESD